MPTFLACLLLPPKAEKALWEWPLIQNKERAKDKFS